MKLKLAQLCRIRRLHSQGMRYEDIAKKFKGKNGKLMSRTLLLYYLKKSSDVLYRSKKVGRPKGGGQKQTLYREYSQLINSLPATSYYRFILTKQLEKEKLSK